MISQLANKVKNAFSFRTTRDLAADFLRFGSKQHATWGAVQVSDKDFYTGYSYAIISRRAKAVARLAPELVEIKSKINDPISPHIEAISESDNFSESQFYRYVSTFLDL